MNPYDEEIAEPLKKQRTRVDAIKERRAPILRAASAYGIGSATSTRSE